MRLVTDVELKEKEHFVETTETVTIGSIKRTLVVSDQHREGRDLYGWIFYEGKRMEVKYTSRGWVVIRAEGNPLEYE